MLRRFGGRGSPHRFHRSYSRLPLQQQQRLCSSSICAGSGHLLNSVATRYTNAVRDAKWEQCEELHQEWWKEVRGYCEERRALVASGAPVDVAFCDETLALFARAFESKDGANAPIANRAQMMMKCGVLIELGGNPRLVIDQIFPIAVQLYDFLRQVNEVSETDRAALAVHLDNITLPIIAAFSRLTSSERANRIQTAPDLASWAKEVEKIYDSKANAPYFLNEILLLLDDGTPLVIMEPETKTAVAARLTGISDNMQLLALVEKHFPSPVVSSNNAQSVEEEGPTFVARWDFMSHEYFGADGHLHQGVEGNRHRFVWGSDKPADIPICPEIDPPTRLLVLAPRTNDRMISRRVSFSGLASSMELTPPFPAELYDRLRTVLAKRTASDRWPLPRMEIDRA